MDDKEPASNWEYQAPAETNENDTAASTKQPSTYAAEPIGQLQWTASEYIAHQKSVGWFVILGCSSAVLGLIVYLLSDSILSAFVVVLVCLGIAVFAARPPQNVAYELDEQGVHVGPKFYPYAQFKSFSVVDEGAISCIWLRSLKKYQPTVAMYFAPEDENAIVEHLANFLPNEMRSPDAFDRMSQRFRF